MTLLVDELAGTLPDLSTTEGLDTIAQRLVRLRKERGLTQAQMAERLGVSQPVVSDYERVALRLHGASASRCGCMAS